MPTLAARLGELEARIRRACEQAGRERASVELLPVSKRQGIETIRAAAHLGFRRFAENYVQEGAAKAEALPDLEFVLIGPLQRNKARPALRAFRELQTVDRVDLAQRLQNLAEEEGLVRHVWIQVDLWGETTKAGGCPEAHLQSLWEALKAAPALPLQGFMAIPPPDLPAAFQDLARLRSEWQDRLGHSLKLSMGMTGDLEAAITAGSDQIRIGTGFFGERG